MDEKVRLADSKNYLSIDYDPNDEATCVYIQRLSQMLDNTQFISMNVLDNMLDTVIRSDLREIKEIGKNLDDALSKLTDRSISMRGTIQIAKVLSKYFNRYHQLIVNMNQMETIRVEGIDDARVIELEDTISEDKVELKRSLDELSEKYRKFFDESDRCYNALNKEHKNLILMNIHKIVSSENQDIAMFDEAEVINEGFIDWIFTTTVKLPIKLLKFVISYWKTVLVALGIGWLYRNSLILVFFSMIIPTIKNTLIVFGLIIMACSTLYIYHRYYDVYHKDENQKLDKILDQKNQESTRLNDTNSLPKEDDGNSSFRGYSNTGSYKPKSEDIKSHDDYNIF